MGQFAKHPPLFGLVLLALWFNACSSTKDWVGPEGTTASIRRTNGDILSAELVGFCDSTVILASGDSFIRAGVSSITFIDLNISQRRTWLWMMPLLAIPSFMMLDAASLPGERLIAYGGLAVTGGTAVIMEASGPKTTFRFPLNDDDTKSLLPYCRYPFSLSSVDVDSLMAYAIIREHERSSVREIPFDQIKQDRWLRMADGTECAGEVLDENSQFVAIKDNSRISSIPHSMIVEQRPMMPGDMKKDSWQLRWRLTLHDGRAFGCRSLRSLEGDSLVVVGLSGTYLVSRESIKELRSLREGMFAEDETYDFSSMNEMNKLSVLQMIVAKEKEAATGHGP